MWNQEDKDAVLIRIWAIAADAPRILLLTYMVRSFPIPHVKFTADVKNMLQKRLKYAQFCDNTEKIMHD